MALLAGYTSSRLRSDKTIAVNTYTSKGKHINRIIFNKSAYRVNWFKFSGFGDIFIGQTNNKTVRRKSLLITDTIMLSRSSYFIEKLLVFRNISKVNVLM